MSFKVAYTDVTICNRALSRLPHSPLTNLATDPGLAARECRLWYKPTVRKLLELYDWGLATKREAMAEAPVNDRPEWAYCYLAPNDLGFAKSLLPTDQAISGVGYYQGLRSLQNTVALRMQRVGGKIYSHWPGATLEYTSLEITEAEFTEVLVEAIDLTLASKIAMPITKNQQLADGLAEKAREHINQALAADRQQQGQKYGEGLTETERARELGVDFGYSGYPTEYSWPRT
jgi:hypothetical protein